MCLLMYGNGVIPDKENFNKIWQANSDGAWVGWIDGGKTHYAKGFMRLKDITNFCNDNVKIFSGVWVLHFRMCSSGSKSAALTHPFIEGNYNGLLYSGNKPLLFQNGHDAKVIETYINSCILNRKKIVNGELNDARAIAQLIKPCGLEILNYASGKFVLLTKKGALQFGDFETIAGVKYSNTYWKAGTQAYLGYSGYGVGYRDNSQWEKNKLGFDGGLSD